MFTKAAAGAANTRGTSRAAARACSFGRRSQPRARPPRGVRRAAGRVPRRGDRDARRRARSARSSRSPATRRCRNPNGGRLASALASLDFMVSFDIYLNETTRHAARDPAGPLAARGPALRPRAPRSSRSGTTRTSRRRSSRRRRIVPSDWQRCCARRHRDGPGPGRRHRRARRLRSRSSRSRSRTPGSPLRRPRCRRRSWRRSRRDAGPSACST